MIRGKHTVITMQFDIKGKWLRCNFRVRLLCDFRLDLMEHKWLPFLGKLQEPIPITEGLDPLSMLTDDATIAGWQNEGLPSDRMSTENATILTSCERWPLMIDPQLQVVEGSFQGNILC